jgi:hypothetical protein
VAQPAIDTSWLNPEERGLADAWLEHAHRVTVGGKGYTVVDGDGEGRPAQVRAAKPGADAPTARAA